MSNNKSNDFSNNNYYHRFKPTANKEISMLVITRRGGEFFNIFIDTEDVPKFEHYRLTVTPKNKNVCCKHSQTGVRRSLMNVVMNNLDNKRKYKSINGDFCDARKSNIRVFTAHDSSILEPNKKSLSSYVENTNISTLLSKIERFFGEDLKNNNATFDLKEKNIIFFGPKNTSLAINDNYKFYSSPGFTCKFQKDQINLNVKLINNDILEFKNEEAKVILKKYSVNYKELMEL